MYALVTGATSGIGEAIACEFAQAGHALILVGRQEEALKRIGRKLSQTYGVEVIGCKVDLCNRVAVNRFVAWLKGERLKLRFIVNNAGVGQYGLFENYTYEKDQLMIETNIVALTDLTKNLLPLLSPGGQILQVASTAAFAPGPYMAVYYATKAYVLSLGLALRSELKARDIGVSVLCPGPTRTPFVKLAEMTKTDFAALWAMSPEQVAKVAYKGLMRNQGVIIPGMSNQVAAMIMRRAPLRWGATLVSSTQKKD